MEIERNFYTETLRQIETEEATEDREEMKQMLKYFEKQEEKRVRLLNIDKRNWFEGLANSVIEFAEACHFNVKMRVKDDIYGIILFETSFFELDWRDPPELHAFWAYLHTMSDSFNITHCEELFKMEFQFLLFSVHEAE